MDNEMQFKLRLPAELKAMLGRQAGAAGRSLSAEIVHRLEVSCGPHAAAPRCCDAPEAGQDGAHARIDSLVGAIAEQARQIGELATHVGVLVQSVAQLLGEETGHPVDDEPEPQRTDLDGNPY